MNVLRNRDGDMRNTHPPDDSRAQGMLREGHPLEEPRTM